ncbi:hypothetical protein AMELA_G00154110 [Ameiurus melas]|uniref:Uncharacterized protein n=1 Tax=Ameiurus melas TaxID=219545 RepID=A0A7J6AI83_AMEME|nr:hypothetical protein AMELA_G00154110 [Ameiurus melas]
MRETPAPKRSLHHALWHTGWMDGHQLRRLRCCQVHDNCYGDTLKHKACWPIFDNPYTEIYAYSCKTASHLQE